MSIETLKNAGQILMMTAEDLQSVFSSMMETFLEQQKENESKQTKKEDLLSSAEVRQLFNIQKCTLCHWVKRGYLNPIKLGNKHYYKQSDINELMNERQNA